MKDEETLYLKCECRHDEHLVKFTYVDSDEYDVGHVYLATQLSRSKVWYQRIWLAIQYIFGAQCRFGHWHPTSLEYPDMKRLRDFLNEAITETEKDRRTKMMWEENHD